MAFTPKPGPQRPDKYPQTGPNYSHYGEVYGFNYDPVTDRYYRDPKTEPGYEEPKKSPGTLETLGYGAGAVGLGVIANEAGKDIYNWGTTQSKPTPTNTPTQTAPTGQTGATTTPTSPQVTTNNNSGLVGNNTNFTPSADGQGIVVGQGQAVPEGYTAVGTSADGGQYAVKTSSIESGSIDWGQVGAGVQGGVQLYAAYQGYKDKDYADAAVYGTAGAVNVAAAAGSESAASVAPYAAYGVAAYNLGKGLNDTYKSDTMTDEQKATRAQQQVGLAYLDLWSGGTATMGEGWLRRKYPSFFKKLDKLDRANPATWAARTFGSSKDSDQLTRDYARKKLQEVGFFTKKEGDSHHYVELADGSLFDVGVDGKNTFEGVSGDKLHPYDVDFSNPESVRAADYLGPLLTILTGGEGKVKDDFVGYLSNASISNGRTIENIRHIYEKAGLDKDGAIAMIDKMVEEEKLKPDLAEIYKQRAAELFSENVPSAKPGLVAPATEPQPQPPTQQVNPQNGPNDPMRFPEQNVGLVGANPKMAQGYPQAQPILPNKLATSTPQPTFNNGLIASTVPTPQPAPQAPAPQPTANIIWANPGQSIPGYKAAPTFGSGGQPGQVAYVKDKNYGLIGAAV